MAKKEKGIFESEADNSEPKVLPIDGVTVDYFLANSKKVREYSKYMIPGFKHWINLKRSTVKQWRFARSEEEWEKLFLEFVNRPVA